MPKRRLERLWAPWRYAYVVSIKEEKECFLCKAAIDKDDEANLVVYRGDRIIVVLNKYPYNPGHLLIAPIRHVPSIEDLNDKELFELAKTIRLSKLVLDEVYKPNGYNIGINLGKAAGAGLEGHLHVHIVPRWIGDTNFIVVLSNTKVIVEALNQSYRKLKTAFSEVG